VRGSPQSAAALSLDEITDRSEFDDSPGSPADSVPEPRHTDDEANDDVAAIDEALTRLAALDSRHAQIVEMRYFGGLTIEETAQALNISDATVKREWTLARAWLRRELSRSA
jgi:RNA polymerase sigma factor (sigma-70 family)